MRKIYTFRQTRDKFTATRGLVAVAVLALVTGLVTHQVIEWPRQAVASAPMPVSAPLPVSGTARTDATIYFPAQYELHAGPPEPLPATF